MSAAVTVARAELAAAVTTVSMGLPKRPVVPVLGGMLVTVSAGSLELAVFDYETSIRLVVAAGTDGAGTVLVPGKELAAAVKALPRTRGAQAVLTVTGDGLVIGCDGTETMLSALPRGGYPQLPEMPEHAGDVDAEAFAAAVGRVAACAGTDDTLPALTCVQFASGDGRLEFAATDRYRLGIEGVSWTGADGLDVLVPAAQLTSFVKKMRRDGKVSVHAGQLADGDGHIGFSDGMLTVMTRPNAGTFPKVRGVVRGLDGDTTVITADAKTLAGAVTALGKLTGRGEPVRFTVSGGRVHLAAMRDGKPAGTRSVTAGISGPDIEVRFCPVYLASLLTGIDGDARIGILADPAPKAEADAGKSDAEPAMLKVTRPATVRAGEFTGVVVLARLQS